MAPQAAENLPEKPVDDVPINALGIGLDPSRRKKDGLFSKPGMSLVEAKRLLPGIEHLFLAESGASVGMRKERVTTR